VVRREYKPVDRHREKPLRTTEDADHYWAQGLGGEEKIPTLKGAIRHLDQLTWRDVA